MENNENKTINELMKTNTLSDIAEYVQSFLGKKKLTEIELVPVVNATIGLIKAISELEVIKEINLEDDNPTYKVVSDDPKSRKVIYQAFNTTIKECTDRELKNFEIGIEFLEKNEIFGKIKKLIALNSNKK